MEKKSICHICGTDGDSREWMTLLSHPICNGCEQVMVHLHVTHPCYQQYVWKVRALWKSV